MSNMQEVLEFAASEKDFIYNFGVNIGFHPSYPKVTRCYFLSSEAKQLYQNISNYAFQGKRDCFPGQATLRAELGWGTQKLDKYLDELRESGLITTKRRSSSTLVYRIEELHSVTILAHSEIIHMVKLQYGENLNDFYEALNAYKKSDLYRKVSKADNPTLLQPVIEQWFYQYVYQAGSEMMEPEEVEIASPPEPELPPVSTTPFRPAVPKVPNTAVGAKLESEVEEKKGKKHNPDPYTTPTVSWNTNHFISYFCKEYTRLTKGVYLPKADERKSLSKIVAELGDEGKERLKTHIDNFLALDFFQVKTIRAFCSNFSQTTLDSYINSGKLPTYMESRRAKNKPRLEDDGENLNELWEG